MKTFESIYLNFKDKFYSNTKVDVARGSAIDMIVKSMSYLLFAAHSEIESNKKPYLFTSQTGTELDNTGVFLQCHRMQGESDENYKYRLMQWTKRNAANNLEAINLAIKSLTLSSSATFIPHSDGVGTAAVYIIPLNYDNDYITTAINEAKEKIGAIISPSSIIDYRVPSMKSVKLVSYLDVASNADVNYVKKVLIEKIQAYINAIPPGERMMLGTINNLALSTAGVEYFNVAQVYLDDKESTAFEILQTTQNKMLFNEIIWWEVSS